VATQAHGSQTPLLDLEELRATYLMRRLVEPYAMKRTAFRLGVGDRDRARELNGRLALAGQRGDAAGILKADRNLHFFLFERCGSPALVRRIHGLWIASVRDVAGGAVRRHAQAVAEHRALLDALALGDLSAVAMATAAHVTAEYAVAVEGLTGRRPADPLFGERTFVHFHCD
jgi:DNA-binding GntR family transcriptional regulator